MEHSKFLAKAIGIYLLIVSLAMLANMDHFLIQVGHLLHDQSLVLVTGFFTLMLGILLVLSHNVWKWDWRILVTLIAWLAFLKGATILLFPPWFDRVSFIFLANTTYGYVAAGFDLFLGLMLCYFGFKHR